MVLTLAIKVTH